MKEKDRLKVKDFEFSRKEKQKRDKNPAYIPSEVMKSARIC